MIKSSVVSFFTIITINRNTAKHQAYSSLVTIHNKKGPSHLLDTLIDDTLVDELST